MKLRAGDWVQVRCADEILRTLDSNGRLDGLPFMPQMFGYCGLSFRVVSSAYKTCDTVSGNYRGRRLPDSIHLDIRCDGQAYGGCQAACLIFWKTAWLKPVAAPELAKSPVQGHPGEHDALPQGICTDLDVRRATVVSGPGEEPRYSCQATELLNYTAPLKWWDVSQYVEAYTSGNRTLAQVGQGLFFLFYCYAALALSDRWGRPARWLYNRFQALTNGVPFPRLKGKIPLGHPTPRRDLGLQPGDLVRIRPYDEILATLDTRLSNRGLAIDAELAPFCGKVFRVGARIDRFVDERTGKMRLMKTPAVTLEGVVCQSLYAGQRLFCPRSIHLWCREIWLERVLSDVPVTAIASCGGRVSESADSAAVGG
jgi:hypothetical protein